MTLTKNVLWLVATCGLYGCAFFLRTPELKTPQELADYSKCDVDRISFWIAQSHYYKVTKGWEKAEECMKPDRTYDCTCMAVIANETLKSCGYNSRILTLHKGDKYHAVVYFSRPDGTRGFISGIVRREYDRKALFDDINSDMMESF